VLLRVQLDDELLLHRRRDLTTVRLAQHLGGERVVVGLQPSGTWAVSSVASRMSCSAPVLGLDGDDVAVADL
jgi:hypothetical protein